MINNDAESLSQEDGLSNYMLLNTKKSILLSDEKYDFTEDETVNDQLIQVYDDIERLGQFLKNGPDTLFSLPPYFTENEPDYFSSAEEMKLWERAMVSALGKSETLEDCLLFSIRGIPPAQSSKRDIRKVNRLLGYPATAQWIDNPDVTKCELVISESLLSEKHYSLNVYGIPGEIPVIQLDKVLLLEKFFRQRGDEKNAKKVKEQIEPIRKSLSLASYDAAGSPKNDPLLDFFKRLFPSRLQRLFTGRQCSAKTACREFRDFCESEAKWAHLFCQMQCILKTALSRGCEPLEVTGVTDPLLAQVLYVVLHQTGKRDRIIFPKSAQDAFGLNASLLKLHEQDDPVIYQHPSDAVADQKKERALKLNLY